MAHRPLPLPPRMPALPPPGELARRAWRDASRPRLPAREGWSLLLWQLFWSPLWLGSDVPAPRFPTRDRRPPVAVGAAGEQVVRMLDGLARRLWMLRALSLLVRAAWLGPAVGCVWLLVELNGGPAFDGAFLPPFTAVALTLALLLAVVSRPTRAQVARMLDRSFSLHDRMATAVGNLGRAVPAPGEPAAVPYLQVADAANVVSDIRRHPAFRVRPPVREIVLAIACGLLFTALAFLRGVGGDIPAVAAGVVPAFEPAAERIAAEEAAARVAEPATPDEIPPTTAEVQAQADRSNEAQRDLQALGGALEDQAVTRPAGEAIAGGEYGEAASDLQEVAPDADQLSPGARDALADDLDTAADTMSPGSENLAAASRAAADGLREGGTAAEAGVASLAEAVEETGNEVVSQQDLAAAMERAEAAEASGQTGEAAGEPSAGDESGQPSDQGQAGAEGEAGAAGEAGAPGEEGTGGEAQPGETGSQPGGGQPGEGEGQQPGQGPGEGDEGASGEGEQGQPGPGQPGAPGESGQAGQTPGDGGQPGEGQPTEGQPTDGGQAQQGGGAGTGEGEPNPNGETGEAPPAGSEEPGSGVPAEQRVTEATAPDGAGAAPEGEPGETTGRISLSGSGREGVQTSGDNGSSSTGSGSGSAARTGSATQGEVGEAGPDSNRVPTDYRDLVEDYFTEPEDE